MQKGIYKYLTSTSRAEASNGLRLNSAALAAVVAPIVACLVNFGEIRARILSERYLQLHSERVVSHQSCTCVKWIIALVLEEKFERVG